MKKVIAVFLVVVLPLTLNACSADNEGSLREVIYSVYDSQSVVSGALQSADSDSGPTEEVDTDGSLSQNADGNGLDVDYSPYSALLKAYTLDYNIENISATDYRIKGLTLSYTYPYAPNDSMLDASGFCYANLVDLDNNGVLELVLVAYNEQEWGDATSSLFEDKISISLLQYPKIIKIYTISPQVGLEFLGSLPMRSLVLPVSMNYGVQYIISDNKTYIADSFIYQMGDGEVNYYGLTDGYFSREAYFKLEIDGSSIFEGREYSDEETDELIASFGESEIHVIENMNDSYIAELEAINAATFSFLENYPVTDFESFSGVYNDGQFYYMEQVVADFYPPEFTIKNYYHALTMRDYETLSDLGISDEEIDFMQSRYNPDDPRSYVPGYIISNLEQVTIDMIENTEMANDIEEHIALTPSADATIMFCRVNEVLDPHKSALGLQVAGGTYDTYFILYSDDEDELNWKISAIYDDKFYW